MTDIASLVTQRQQLRTYIDGEAGDALALCERLFGPEVVSPPSPQPRPTGGWRASEEDTEVGHPASPRAFPLARLTRPFSPQLQASFALDEATRFPEVVRGPCRSPGGARRARLPAAALCVSSGPAALAPLASLTPLPLPPLLPTRAGRCGRRRPR